MERAQCGTIREKIFKIGAQVKVSVRRALVSLSSAWPLRDLFISAPHDIQNIRLNPLAPPSLAPPRIPQIC